MRNIKLLAIIDHLGGGGAEQQFVNIVNNITAEKQVYLTVARGVRLASLDSRIPLSGGYGGRTPLKSIMKIRGLIESFQPDIVHSFLMYSCFLTALALKLSRVKPVFIAQEFSSPEEIMKEVNFGYLKKQILKLTYKQADKVLTISKAVMEDMIQIKYVSGGKAAFIHDGLDIKKYKNLKDKMALRKELGLEDGLFYICFAGSLVKRKGPHFLIKAFRRLPYPNIRLLLIGKGDMAEELKRESADDVRISFLGYRTNAVEYIKSADLFVLPSVYEGLPNVVIEAMAAGTPVVATNIYGTPELIEDKKSGILVPAGDVDALEKAISEMIGNTGEREMFSKEALTRADYFSIERMAGDYQAMYSTLLEKPTTKRPR
ncbi:MAG: glycosyltransferase [Nitrospiraceae bacterium]|nr:glycosyltransferase [Nitrospiraceae bacterium]